MHAYNVHCNVDCLFAFKVIKYDVLILSLLLLANDRVNKVERMSEGKMRKNRYVQRESTSYVIYSITASVTVRIFICTRKKNGKLNKIEKVFYFRFGREENT